MLIDTHAHLDFPDFAGDLEEVLQRAREAGVERILTIGTGLESSRRAVALAEAYDPVFAVVGIHPCHAHEEEVSALAGIEALLAHPKVVAVGETGLDYYRLEPATIAAESSNAVVSALQGQTMGEIEASALVEGRKIRQAEFFRAQLELAVRHGRNVVIHQRAAWEDCLTLLGEFTGRLAGVFHCFGGTAAEARQVLDMGHYVSFTGIATFKNAAQVRETAASLPPDRFFVETDCPYLAPVPHRGQRCEPAHTRLVAEELARVRHETFAELACSTTTAAQNFFKGL